jgi:hypothetical protein
MEEYSWSMNDRDKMIIDIKYLGNKLFSISLHEAIESSSRNAVLKHVRDCDNTPWLRRWQAELAEAKDIEADHIVGLLKGRS